MYAPFYEKWEMNCMSEATKNLTSIIITVEHDQTMIERCLDSIEKNTESPYEIIAVQDGADEETVKWLSERKGIRFLAISESTGITYTRNKGMAVATGDMIVFMQDNSIVFKDWLKHMRDLLYSNDRIGAVGPLTNISADFQTLYAKCNSFSEWATLATKLSESNELKDIKTQYLNRFCFAVKREIVDQCGLYDEKYSPIGFEDLDYCLRIMKSGHQLAICFHTMVYCEDVLRLQTKTTNYKDILNHNLSVFQTAWGFDPTYSMICRNDLISLIDAKDTQKEIRILEIGCACGTTLLTIKQKFPNAKLYGIELNPASAEIAKLNSDVITGNIETIDLHTYFDEKSFDYIICGDVLEHLVDPWTIIKTIRTFIKDKGYLLISIPNIMHISIIQSLLYGNWSYQNFGILDHTHLRFFTKQELEKVFKKPDFSSVEYQVQPIRITEEQQELINKLNQINPAYKTEQMYAYQYRIKAQICHEPTECDNVKI